MPLLNSGASTFYTNSLSGTADGDFYEMRENGGVTVQIAGTWSGTISFQQSNDGISWFSVAALAAPGSGGVQVTSTTTNGMWFMVVQAKYFRALFTSYSSGTAVVTVRLVSDGSINYSFSGSSATGANSDQIQGSAASGATDAGNPVKVGGRFNTTAPTLTDGQRGDAQLTSRAELLVSISTGGIGTTTGANTADGISANQGSLNVRAFGYAFNGTSMDRLRGDANGLVVQSGLSSTFWNYAAAAGGIVSSTADVAIAAARGAGVRNYLKSLTVSHDTLSAATELVIKDGASTVIYRGKLQTAAVEGGSEVIFDPPLRGTANTAMNVALLTSVTGGVYVNATGYTGV